MKKSLTILTAGLLAVTSLFMANAGQADAKADAKSITCAGSTALQPLAEQAAQLYMNANSGVSVMVQGGGSGTGLKNVSDGVIDIGNSDVFAEEKLDAGAAKQLVDHQVCVAGFAAVVNKKVSVSNLTSKQLIAIFTGKVTNWKQVGGKSMKIVVVNRPKSSGTRATFKKYALQNKEEAQGLALTEDSSGAVEKAIGQTDGAIGYLATSYLSTKDKAEVKTLKLNGVAPTYDNIVSGKYPVWAYEHMYTKGEAKGLAKDFLKFISSKDISEKVVKKLGYIPIDDMKVKR